MIKINWKDKILDKIVDIITGVFQGFWIIMGIIAIIEVFIKYCL